MEYRRTGLTDCTLSWSREEHRHLFNAFLSLITTAAEGGIKQDLDDPTYRFAKDFCRLPRASGFDELKTEHLQIIRDVLAHYNATSQSAQTEALESLLQQLDASIEELQQPLSKKVCRQLARAAARKLPDTPATLLDGGDGVA